MTKYKCASEANVMRIDVITLFPEFISTLTQIGVVGRAQQRQLLQVQTWNPRDYTEDNHRTVDGRPFGGGPGMVMLIEPLRRTVHAAQCVDAQRAPVIYLSPQGARLTQKKVQQLSEQPRLILMCGRYEGIDERLMNTVVDEELSIGDYVLSGADLAAAIVIDAVGRLLDGVLGNSESAAQDSFSEGLLDYPHYTRPEWDPETQQSIPAVLLSGNHAEIEKWRMQQALGRTWLKRPDLLAQIALTTEQRILLTEFQVRYWKTRDCAL